MRTSTAHLARRAVLHPVLARPLCGRGSLPLRALLRPFTITGLDLHLELELSLGRDFGADSLEVGAPPRRHPVKRAPRSDDEPILLSQKAACRNGKNPPSDPGFPHHDADAARPRIAPMFALAASPALARASAASRTHPATTRAARAVCGIARCRFRLCVAACTCVVVAIARWWWYGGAQHRTITCSPSPFVSGLAKLIDSSSQQCSCPVSSCL